MTIAAESPPIRPAADGTAVRTRRALRRHPFRVAFTVCVAALVGLGLGYSRWTAHQLSLSFRPQQVTYTELFFPRLNALPTHMVAGVRSTLPFTIVNREGKRETYRYKVVLFGPAGSRVVDAGKVTVNDSHQKVVTASFVPRLTDSTYTVEVMIQPSHEFIEMHGRTK
jgi:hypothetical protein